MFETIVKIPDVALRKKKLEDRRKVLAFSKRERSQEEYLKISEELRKPEYQNVLMES